MNARTPEVSSVPVGTEEARELTERIKSTTKQVCLLLLEAHQRRAWVVLGYRSWGEYVRTELGLSRSRSYELLDQARVIRTIQIETGTSEVPNISPYVAGQIRAHVAEITMEIRARIVGVHEDRVLDVVMEIIDEVRGRTATRRERPAVSSVDPERPGVDMGRLEMTIQRLANMPPTRRIIAQIPRQELPLLARVSRARRWLELAVRQLRPLR